MKSSIWFAVAPFSFVTLTLPPAIIDAYDINHPSAAFTTAESSQQKHIKICRTRYRGCLSLKQIPSGQCQYIYEDCLHHTV
jgi:hypothetical protein